MPKIKVYRKGLVNDLESKLKSSSEALRLALEAKLALDAKKEDVLKREHAKKAAAAAKDAYAELDELIGEAIGPDMDFLKIGEKNGYSKKFGRYLLSSTIGGSAAQILYDLAGTLSHTKKGLIYDRTNIFAEIVNDRHHRYYRNVRHAALTLSSFEKFDQITGALEYIRGKYSVPELPTAK